MQENQHVNREDIKRDLAALGIKQNDTVFFHSSMKSIGYVEGGADTVLDAFLETIGKNGTLSLPALCMYDFKNTDPIAIRDAWDIKNTPTYTGVIPETFRKRPGTLRSDNPTHSVTAYGKNAEYIVKDHSSARGAETCSDRPIWASASAFGFDSPWERLYELDAKCLLIGVGFYNCTMIHHVQVMYWEEYTGKIDPKAPWPTLDFHKMGDKLEELGVVQTGYIGSSFTKLIGCKLLVDAALDIMAAGGP